MFFYFKYILQHFKFVNWRIGKFVFWQVKRQKEKKDCAKFLYPTRKTEMQIQTKKIYHYTGFFVTLGCQTRLGGPR